jgi:glutamine cyclotransferase
MISKPDTSPEAAHWRFRGIAPKLLMLLLLLGSPAGAVQQYGYRVIDQRPQSRDTFVQGLEIVDGQLYVSSGLYGKSRLQRFDFATGELELERRLAHNLFAEGVTVLGDRLFQLTWRERQLLVYNKGDLEQIERWRLPGEGWGITNDGEQLIYSDGSDRLYFVGPDDRRVIRVISVTEAGTPVVRLNELEWIEGRIWANVWLTERIVIINPDSGEVEGSIDLQGLLPAGERRPDTNALNGIASNPADGGLWVTGKNWPWLYRIELVPEMPGQAATPATKSR